MRLEATRPPTAGSTGLAPPSTVVDQAIAWRVRLQSGAATAQEEEACRQWQHAHPSHAQAWARLDALGQRIKGLPSPLTHATLLADASRMAGPRAGRRAVLKSLALVSGGSVLAWGVSQEGSLRGYTADHRTGPGERAERRLADGSTLQLNTSTAVDERFDARWRCVVLRHGELRVDCVPDAQRPARPFVVRTAEGELRAPAGRFLVRQLEGRTRVQADAGEAEVWPRLGGAPTRLGAGQALHFDREAAEPPTAADGDAAAWLDGLLVAKRMRLADFTSELERYRRGWLRCAPAVAELRISGVFPLDDPPRVLAALERTLPVRVRAATRYWVTLVAR